MHLSFPWKSKIQVVLILFFVCLSSLEVNAQKRDFKRKSDSLAYRTFSDELVVYSDYGFGTAPFSIKFENKFVEKQSIRYRNNYQTVLGLGFSYKWLSLRFGIPIPGNLRPISKFGRSESFNLGFDFSFKKFHFDVALRSNSGYAVKNANQWNDTLTELFPNDIRPNTNNISLSLNTYYFHNKQFKIQALIGKTAYYTQEVKTFYLKGTLNLHVVNNSSSLIPADIFSPTNTKTQSNYYSAFDFGILPGYAYVNNKKNWQYSARIGFGPVLQLKAYETDQTIRSFLGLAPRYDIRFLGGYNVPEYFVMLITEFDNKSVRFTDLQYRTSFYAIKLVAGYRFLDSKKVKKHEL
jgi:hypothetical protein